MRYLLCDANVVAAYYLPRSMRSVRARTRIEAILNAVRSGGGNHFLYIPNICIAEVFSVFAKYSFGRWNRHLKKQGTIDSRVYKSLVKQFETDIHNGHFFYQYELSRYHVLGVDLVAPVDHYFQISRGKGRWLGHGFNQRRVRVRRNIAGFSAHRRNAFELLISNIEPMEA